MNDFELNVSRLIAAAVVNASFRHTLLTNSADALQGYGSEKFRFTPTEHKLIHSIHATSLQEFANQIDKLTGKLQDSRSTTQK